MSTTARLISLSVITALIVFVGITFFQVISPFLLPLFLAGIIAVLCQPLHRAIERRWNGHHRLAAGVTTAIVMLVVLVPVAMGILVLTVKLGAFVTGALEDDSLVNWVRHLQEELHVKRVVERLEPLLGSELDRDAVEAELQESTKAAAEWLAAQTVGLAGVAVGMLGGLVSSLVKLAMFVIALYYFLADGLGFVRAAEHLVPLQANYQRDLIEKFNATTRAVVVGTFVAAIVQGVTTGVLLYYFGFEQFIVLWPLATFCSLIPVVGTSLVWGPCAVWLVAIGHWWSAFFLVALGAGIVGALDNVVRAYILQTDAKLHPLLGFVCVLGGIQVMGLWGVFIGPLVASILHALIVIFNTELEELSKHRAAEQVPEEPL